MNIWFTRGLARRLAGKRVDVYRAPRRRRVELPTTTATPSIFYKAASPSC